MLNLSKEWLQFAEDSAAIEQLEKEILPGYLKTCRWFAGKARKLAGISIEHVLTISDEEKVFHLLIVKAKYATGKSEDYLLPVSLVHDVIENSEKAKIADSTSGFLIDAIYDEAFRRNLFTNLFRSSKVKLHNGALFFERGTALHEQDYSDQISSRVLNADQSNSSLIYEGEGNAFFLKVYRKLFRETNPDVEVVKFLSEKAAFTFIPSFAGTFYWKKAYGSPITLGMMQQKVTAIKDAWSLAGDYLNEFLISVSEGNISVPAASISQASLLGERTAGMHAALASDFSDPAFSPEPFNDEYTDWLLNSCESLLKRRIRLTKDCYSTLDESGKDLVKHFLSNQQIIRDFFARIKQNSFSSLRTRIHGDYHLGQILFDGNDYLILDFEGEPESSIKDRKIKHSPLKDVAGMLRSFHYAVSAKLLFSDLLLNISAETIEAAVHVWYDQVTKAFLNSYWQTLKENKIFHAEKSELKFLLQYHLLEKAVYELGYELNGRPTWVKIPLQGIENVLQSLAASEFNK